MAEWRAAFSEAFPSGVLHAGISLSTLTTWGVGGSAELLVEPESVDQAETAIRLARDSGVPCRVLGWGSNLLASDAGIPGLVIRSSRGFDHVRVDGDRVVAESGCGLSSLAGTAALQGLSGLEFAVGIPGSLGGGVALNAGAEGSHLADVVQGITVLRRSGERENWGRRQIRFDYRSSRLLDEPAMVVDVILKLRRDDPERIRRKTEELRARRSRQPAGRSAGSVFRNPDGDFAGRLLEISGAKSMRIGRAAVSSRHANFILTETGASASDVLDLIRLLQETVKRETGVLLQPEVIFAGYAAAGPTLPQGARILQPLG